MTGDMKVFALDASRAFGNKVATRYVASLFEAVGVDRVVKIDVHNLATYQNAFRCRTEHREARPLFADHIAAQSQPIDPHALFEAKCSRCHDPTKTLAR